MSLHVWNFGELLFERERCLQRFEIQRVRSLEHQQCMLNIRKQAFKILRSSNDRVPCHHESLDGRVCGKLHSAVNACDHQAEESGRDISSRAQHAQESFYEPFRNEGTPDQAHLPKAGTVML